MPEWVNNVFSKYWLVRRTLVFWAIGMATSVLTFCVMYPEKVSDPISRVFIAIIGLVSIAVTFYQYSRDRETGYDPRDHHWLRRGRRGRRHSEKENAGVDNK